MSESAPYLQLQNVHKHFGKTIALDDISLDVQPGEFLFLLGPSGCGKTTLLRIIAGLEDLDSGRIIQAGRDVTRLPASRRDFGIVFQSYALFPNLTVTDNIAYGLKNQKLPKAQVAARVQELLSLVGLQGYDRRYPAQLSGGQQQRVAIARALFNDPPIIMADEPTGALDSRTGQVVMKMLRWLCSKQGKTVIVVTHDSGVAGYADRLIQLRDGQITGDYLAGARTQEDVA